MRMKLAFELICPTTLFVEQRLQLRDAVGLTPNPEEPILTG